jgi:hypothetical protein
MATDVVVGESTVVASSVTVDSLATCTVVVVARWLVTVVDASSVIVDVGSDSVGLAHAVITKAARPTAKIRGLPIGVVTTVAAWLVSTRPSSPRSPWAARGDYPHQFLAETGA